ncbi:MAG: serine/threonine protein kinase [Planctomycetes bacterium]|nr:serine/threonine protein kinase [Planctomycetota bacterium]
MSIARDGETHSPSSMRVQLDQILSRFVQAWKGAQRPAIEEYLHDGMPYALRLAVLWELVHADYIFRCHLGQEPDPAEYSRRFPHLAAEVDLVQSLVEWRTLRNELQAIPKPDSSPTNEGSSFPGSVPLVPDSIPTFGSARVESVLDTSLGELKTAELEPAAGANSPPSPHTPVMPGKSGWAPHSNGPEPPVASTTCRFEIRKEHARGGLGIVYVAFDRELNREVAFKQMLPKFADDPNNRQRFLLEAEITGALEHPGIVPVHALGEWEDGRPYYVMRFAPGDTLKDAIEEFHRKDNPNRNRAGERQLALTQLLGRLIDVCNAMEYAHSRGVLHRDLKPKNIILGKYGETLIIDWGLAKVHGKSDIAAHKSNTGSDDDMDETCLTRDGTVIGTMAYMSPEQAAGKLEELTPATDVYGLGATLYHLLTGRPAFKQYGGHAAQVERIQRGEFPPPRDVNPEVPTSLQAICLKAMALQPADRYASARELADDLERWMSNEPLAAGIFHQLQQRLSVLSGRSHDGLPDDTAAESSASLSLLSKIPTRRIRLSTDEPGGMVDYELGNLRAESRLARIYLARQVVLDREVVVKAFQPCDVDEETRRRLAPSELARVKRLLQRRDLECFLSEAVVTANLDHPGIIPVLEIFQDEPGRFYIAMKWIRGQTWNKVLRDRSVYENLETLLRASDVVAYAHERGILHRDLKPANIFLGQYGETCVVDWGAALVTRTFRSWDALADFPNWNWVSQPYAAPEQLGREFDRIDERCDVYLLGATLYEIIAGFPPHPPTSTMVEETSMLQRNEIRPTEYRGPLLDIALQAMATQPADRFANVREFQAAIREYLGRGRTSGPGRL